MEGKKEIILAVVFIRDCFTASATVAARVDRKDAKKLIGKVRKGATSFYWFCQWHNSEHTLEDSSSRHPNYQIERKAKVNINSFRMNSPGNKVDCRQIGLSGLQRSFNGGLRLSYLRQVSKKQNRRKKKYLELSEQVTIHIWKLLQGTMSCIKVL